MKDQTILIHPSGSEIPFDPDHAKRLMAMSSNGGWKWKDDPTDASSPDDQIPEVTGSPEGTIKDSSSTEDKGNGVGNSRNKKGTKRAGK